MLSTIDKLKTLYSNNKPWSKREDELSSEELKWIIDQTSFLPSGVKIKERIYCIINDIKSPVICSECNTNKTRFHNESYKTFCSVKCMSQDKSLKKQRQKTCLKKYGVSNPFQDKEIQSKQKETLLKNLGVTNPMVNAEVKTKSLNTRIKKYGKIPSGHNFNNPHFRAKGLATVKEKYGYDFPSQIPEFKEKIRLTNNERYGTNTYSQSTKLVIPETELRQQYIKENRTIKSLAEEYNVSVTTILNNLHDHQIPIINNPSVSSYEKEIADWLSDHVDKIITNSRKILNNGKELDIFLPDHKLAIELNGLYWHRANQTNNKSKYHIMEKLKVANSTDIRILNFWDCEWTNKPDIVKSIILSALGIYSEKYQARKCKILDITSFQYRKFLDENHIQGPINSSERIGLFYDKELISVMGFGKSRFSKNEYELHRFCNKINTTTIGGAQRLFKHFLDNNKNDVITSYCDQRLFTGNLYEKLGFQFSSFSKPNYYYFKSGHNKLLTRQKFQKHKLKDILPESFFDQSLTEQENMERAGYLWVYDCGNKKYVLKR